MAGLFGTTSSTTTTANTVNTTGDTSRDVELTAPPEDSISDIHFSSKSEHLAVASWDKKVRIYEINPDGSSAGKALYEHDAPVLSVQWSSDGSKVASAGADKMAKLFDVATGQAQQVAAADEPIKSVRFCTPPGSSEMLITGSWDKKIRYWDLRTPNPVATVQLPERVYSMDVSQGLLVVGCAERHIQIFNLTNPTTVYKTAQSPLKWQTRIVKCFPDATGYVVGSVEGRCAIQHVEDKQQASNFSFKCHRETPASGSPTVYAINAVSFCPGYGTFSTAGADGTFHLWDKDAKHRLKGYPNVGGTIAATDFNRSGSIFAYAVSYDWSKGYSVNTPQYPNKVMLHPMESDEAKPRSQQGLFKR